MSDENPFNIPDRQPPSNPDATVVIRPNPGARRPTSDGAVSDATRAVPPTAPVAPRSEAPVEFPTVAGGGILANAARPLLMHLGWLRTLLTPPDMSALRDKLMRELDTFRAVAQRAGVPVKIVDEGDYLLSAALDDVIANTPWGSAAEWTRRSLTLARHRDAIGGDKFFALLEKYRRDPAGNLLLVELVYLCLTLGFEGRLRISRQRAEELLNIRESLYRAMLQSGGERYTELSPEWRGADEKFVGKRPLIPIWALSVAAFAGLLIVYLVLSASFRSESIAKEAIGLPPLVSAPKFVEVAPPPVVAATCRSLECLLADDIRAKRIQVSHEEGRNTRIRIVADGFFPSSQYKVDPKYQGLLSDIAKAIGQTSHTVQIIGYTDNQPPSLNISYHSNVELSALRAKAVADILAAEGGKAIRITTEGRGEQEPIGDNATADGRSKNRRIELLVANETSDAP